MKYLRQFSIYTLVGFFGAGVSFMLMPYLSHFLKPEEYGMLSMVNSVVTILIPFIGLTVSGVVGVEYYKKKDERDFASLFSTVQFIPVIPFVVILAVSAIFARPSARFFELPPDKAYWVPLSCVLAFLTIYFEALLAYTVTEQRAGSYAFFNVLRVGVEVPLTLLFVTKLRYGWEGRLYAWLIASVVLFVAAFIYFYQRKLLTPRISRVHSKAALMFGVPLIFHVVGKFVINQSDRLFIAKMVSIDEAGIYNIGYQIGTVMLLVVGAVSNFMQAFLFERLADLTEAAKRQIVRVSYLVLFALFALLIVMTLATPTLFAWFIDKNYARGTRYVFWVGLSYFFWGIYIIFAGYIFYSGKTRVLGLLSVVNVVLNLALNYFLIRAFGPMGAAYATCISFFVVSAVIVWRAHQLYPLPWLHPRSSAA